MWPPPSPSPRPVQTSCPFPRGPAVTLPSPCPCHAVPPAAVRLRGVPLAPLRSSRGTASLEPIPASCLLAWPSREPNGRPWHPRRKPTSSVHPCCSSGRRRRRQRAPRHGHCERHPRQSPGTPRRPQAGGKCGRRQPVPARLLWSPVLRSRRGRRCRRLTPGQGPIVPTGATSVPLRLHLTGSPSVWRRCGLLLPPPSGTSQTPRAGGGPVAEVRPGPRIPSVIAPSFLPHGAAAPSPAGQAAGLCPPRPCA